MIYRDDKRSFALLKEIVQHDSISQIGLSMDEMRELVGLKHRSTVHHHLANLTDQGLVQRVPGLARSTKPTKKGKELVDLMSGE